MWLAGHREVSAAGQGPGELVRPVPKARQALRSPAHCMHPALQSSTRAHAALAAATGIPGQAQQDLCMGRTPAKPPQGSSRRVTLAVPAHRTHRGSGGTGARRQLRSVPWPAHSTHSQESRWFGRRAGKQCQRLPWLPPGAQAQCLPDLHPHPARPQCRQTLPCGSAGR